MKRALVFVDHTDAGCAALEAARRVASTTLAELTVVSLVDEGEPSALAAAAARHVKRAAGDARTEAGPIAETSEVAVESISLSGQAASATRGVIDGARPDLAIIGSRRLGVDEEMLAACLESAADAVLVARAGRRREDHAYRHVAVVGTADAGAIEAASRLAGDDALLSVIGLLEQDAGPSRIADVNLETVACAERNDAEPAVVEGTSADLSRWLRARGVEVVVVGSTGDAGGPSGPGLGADLIARGSADVLVVRGAGPRPRRARRHWTASDRPSPLATPPLARSPIRR